MSDNSTTTAGKSTARKSVSGGRSNSNLSAPKISDTAQDALSHFQEYAKERPEVVALWCLGIGFVLGWKLKPW